ncbi:MAG: DISARM system phospholipase D-like protein DrmC, partial [Vicinamibacterales bacterium]
MIEVLLDLPANVRKRLVQALASDVLQSPYTTAAVRAVVGTTDSVHAITETLGALDGQGVSGKAVAVLIDATQQATSRIALPDLVWSGPEVSGLHARETRRVYEELIGCAERKVWISTYAFFDGPRAFDSLARRMDSQEELAVTILLNIQRKRGDDASADALVRRFADRFWGTDWPGAKRPAVFYDPRSLEPDRPGGVLHAKAVVADHRSVFVTSANLTEAAFERNIELGLLVRDPALAASMEAHFQG